MGMVRLFGAAGAISGLVSVAAGAFGAHALKTRLAADQLAAFETGARYQTYHALALMAVAWAASRTPTPTPQTVWAGWLFLSGTVLFSGSLYMLALTGARWWGTVTPLGGVSFIVGWACLAWAMGAAR